MALLTSNASTAVGRTGGMRMAAMYVASAMWWGVVLVIFAICVITKSIGSALRGELPTTNEITTSANALRNGLVLALVRLVLWLKQSLQRGTPSKKRESKENNYKPQETTTQSSTVPLLSAYADL